MQPSAGQTSVPQADVLIVDDNESNRLLLQDLMSALGHGCRLAEDGAKAMQRMAECPPDVILLDLMMPRMSGQEVLRRVMADSKLRHVPVIIVSGIDELDTVVQCIEAGAADYLTKPFNLTLLRARVEACLAKKKLHDEEQRLRCLAEDQKAALEREVRERVAELTQSHLATIFAVSQLAELRDSCTGAHLERIRQYCVSLSRRLQGTRQHARVINDAFVECIFAASPLHDIGKVAIPDSILLKPGRLTPDEFDVMKQHAEFGARSLRAVECVHEGNEFLRMGIEIAESHHERWDGSGYPHGLAGAAIPLSGRIVALADVYDALTSKRPYKDAISHEESCEIILHGSEGHFDPQVAKAFAAIQGEFHGIRTRYGGNGGATA